MRAGKGDRQTRRAAGERKPQAFGEGLPHQSRRLRPQGHAQRYLLPSLQAAHEHEIGHVGTNDQKYKPGNHHQDLQPMLVLLPHTGNSGAPGTEV